jgi:hypothetical protein
MRLLLEGLPEGAADVGDNVSYIEHVVWTLGIGRRRHGAGD